MIVVEIIVAVLVILFMALYFTNWKNLVHKD